MSIDIEDSIDDINIRLKNLEEQAYMQNIPILNQSAVTRDEMRSFIHSLGSTISSMRHLGAEVALSRLELVLQDYYARFR